MNPETQERLLQALAHEYLNSVIDTDCEVTGLSGSGRCIERAVAVRWESGFLDRVCEEHAQRARNRGTVVVTPRKQDGTTR